MANAEHAVGLNQVIEGRIFILLPPVQNIGEAQEEGRDNEIASGYDQAQPA